MVIREVPSIILVQSPKKELGQYNRPAARVKPESGENGARLTWGKSAGKGA